MENFMDRVHPELKEALEMMLGMPRIDLSDIPALRENPMEMPVPEIHLPGLETVTTETRRVPGPDGAPDVTVYVYSPPREDALLPGLLWIHGGGYVLGSAELDAPNAKRMALVASCVVVSVDYRLAPENPFPAPVEDCYAALHWMASHAADLGVDNSRLAVGGASAGGGLAAGLALLTRDRGEIDLAYQLLIYPMIDDCNVLPASETLRDAPLWTRENNKIGWGAYLGGEPGGRDVSVYASACRATDVHGLPQAYLAVGEMDLFCGESIRYAERLIEAGVLTELHVYPGVFHAFDNIAPESNIGKRFTNDYLTALWEALHGPR
jgi:acetyl esterase/lipase